MPQSSTFPQATNPAGSAIADQIRRYHAELPAGVNLVAVSKFHPIEAVREAYSAGQRLFGESRVDEVVAKAAAMPADCVWHFIGHVQTNKLRRLLPAVHVIESVDSERLLRLISAEAVRANHPVKVLLQVHVAAEETKTGFAPDDLIICARACKDLPAVEICGVMGMASNVDDPARINADFAAIAAVGRRLREIIPSATELSMGMSGDWPMAVAHGATLVRIGTAIFGVRN